MLNFILRRVQKYIFPIKLLLLAGSIFYLVNLILYFLPDLGNIVIFALVFFIFLGLILSFFVATVYSLLVALTISFLLFLRAVGLLTFLNIALFAAFLILLGLYLRKK